MSPKFTFTCEYRDSKGELERKTEVVTTDVAIPDVLEAVEDFLRGCGFFFEGNLEIVNNNLILEKEDDSEGSDRQSDAESEV